MAQALHSLDACAYDVDMPRRCLGCGRRLGSRMGRRRLRPGSLGSVLRLRGLGLGDGSQLLGCKRSGLIIGHRSIRLRCSRLGGVAHNSLGLSGWLGNLRGRGLGHLGRRRLRLRSALSGRPRSKPNTCPRRQRGVGGSWCCQICGCGDGGYRRRLHRQREPVLLLLWMMPMAPALVRHHEGLQERQRIVILGARKGSRTQWPAIALQSSGSRTDCRAGCQAWQQATS
mmetsp:Transcript_102746/g.265606  ORF Transcript_102746/g.265606 Transcript_102746/m.265606 type:complete len:228 (+) Transcript_102746:242-925(+)